MATLKLLPMADTPSDASGELVSCTYTPDGAFVLSGGWDGHLRLWESKVGSHVTGFQVHEKAVTACAVSPDGTFLLSGSLMGMVTYWDAMSHEQRYEFMAHPRPVSAIAFSPDNKILATSSWDGSVGIWQSRREREGVLFSGHQDIVAGCRFLPDSASIVTWSYDMNVRVWDLPHGQTPHDLVGHTDRVLAGDVSADGHWCATGSRDGILKLWDLTDNREAASTSVSGEIRGCMFLLDGETLVVVDANGRVTVHALPFLELMDELRVQMPVHCIALAPGGRQIALGCDGRMRFVSVDGLDGVPFIVNATQVSQRTATRMQKLFGRSEIKQSYHCLCPSCHARIGLPHGNPGHQTTCPKCRQNLRVAGVTQFIQEK